MALETIEQILSPERAPYINGVKAGLKVSPAILENVYQGLVEKDGRGVNDKWVSESDANENAQILVNRVLPINMKARVQGASKNGGSYSSNKHFTQTETVGIDILQIIDDPIRIPRARQDWIKVDLLAQNVKIWSDRLATILNGATFAEKVMVSSLAAERNHVNITEEDVTNKLIAERFMEGNSLLDEGDVSHGIDVFDPSSRVAVFKMAFRPKLKAGGILAIGGANYAYDILKAASITQGEVAKNLEDGYWGTIDEVPVHGISNMSLQHASEFMGFSEGELKNSTYLGYISSSIANARGVSTINKVKTVDDPDGQGLILQPFAKFGVKSWYPLGNVLFTMGGDTVPLMTRVKDLFGTAGISYKLKGAGSRLYPTVDATISTSTFTCTATALDDFNVEHVVKAHYVITDTECKTVTDFIKACYVDKKTHGEVSSLTGGNTTATVASTKYLNVLAIADDGSMTLVSKQNA